MTPEQEWWTCRKCGVIVTPWDGGFKPLRLCSVCSSSDTDQKTEADRAKEKHP